MQKLNYIYQKRKKEDTGKKCALAFSLHRPEFHGSQEKFLTKESGMFGGRKELERRWESGWRDQI
jgi:hypothetical protein